MHKCSKPYPCPYFFNIQMYNMYNMMCFQNFLNQTALLTDEINDDDLIELKDYGPEPYVVNIDEATKQNNNFRTALWTGDNLQVTLMSIPVGEDIGLETHPKVDQFIRIEEGNGLVKIGDRKNKLDFQEKIYDDYAIMIPAGKWHNIINTGDKPLKLYSIYAPPEHPRGTVHETKEIAEAAEEKYK
ncbi:cupin domain-containing protein [Clostridium sediminicola]|uniref:cupin domain-containing protein n=1 Tax=Clostridium sediminicola TaxID=3114879 RepID=UPI003D186D7F